MERMEVIAEAPGCESRLRKARRRGASKSRARAAAAPGARAGAGRTRMESAHMERNHARWWMAAVGRAASDMKALSTEPLKTAELENRT